MFRRSGLLSLTALTAYLFCGMTAPQQCQTSNTRIGPSTGEVVAGGIAIGAVIGAAIAIPIVISHNHHNVKGCVVTDANGLQIEQDDAKTFTLVGAAPGIKVGDLVKLHGTKQKAKKGTKADPTFVVDQLTKDYGACKLPASVVPPAPAP